MKMQSKYVREAQTKWKDTTAAILNTCQEFFDQVVSAISNAGT